MDVKKTALCAAGSLLVAVVWLGWWIQPERQVLRAQAGLVAALEGRDFGRLAALLADDYRDRWEQDKPIVIERCRMVFGEFATLTVERERAGISAGEGGWILSEKVSMRGLGAPLAMAVRDEVNALREPFAMTWRRRGAMPWDWELVCVNHPTLDLPR